MLASGYQRKGLDEYSTASIFGNLTASFAIEQVGPPQLTQDSARNELCNGVKFSDRLDEFIQRWETDLMGIASMPGE